MTDEKFTELVNLYFDNEISSVDFAGLQKELSLNPARKREFEERHQLHQAMRAALNPGKFELASEASQSRSGLPRWLFASGLAACASFGLLLLVLALSNSGVWTAGSTGVEVVTEEELLEFGAAEMERYTAIQREASRRRGSLTAQLRLLGLKPEMTPPVRELQGVDLASLKTQDDLRTRQAALLNQQKVHSTMAQPQLFEALNRPVPAEQTSRWPSGFGASLASFN